MVKTSFPIHIVMLGFLFLFIDECYPMPHFLGQAGKMQEASKDYDTLGAILMNKQQQQQQQQAETRVKRSPKTCIANVTINFDHLRMPRTLREVVCKKQKGCKPVKNKVYVLHYSKTTSDGVHLYKGAAYTYVANCVMSS